MNTGREHGEAGGGERRGEQVVERVGHVGGPEMALTSDFRFQTRAASFRGPCSCPPGYGGRCASRRGAGPATEWRRAAGAQGGRAFLSTHQVHQGAWGRTCWTHCVQRAVLGTQRNNATKCNPRQEAKTRHRSRTGPPPLLPPRPRPTVRRPPRCVRSRGPTLVRRRSSPVVHDCRVAAVASLPIPRWLSGVGLLPAQGALSTAP